MNFLLRLFPGLASKLPAKKLTDPEFAHLFATREEVLESGLLAGSFVAVATEMAKEKWVVDGLVLGDKKAAKATFEKLREAAYAEGDAQYAARTAGAAVGDTLPFLKNESWLALEQARLTTADRNNGGFVVGGTRDASNQLLRPLVDQGYGHVMVLAPLTSGKSASVLVPSLFSDRSSVVVHDIKTEHFMLTSGLRQTRFGQRIVRFEPGCDGVGAHRFNLLDEIRAGTKKEIRDLENIAGSLVDTKGSRAHYCEGAEAPRAALQLFVSIALHLLYTKENACLSDIVDKVRSVQLPQLFAELSTADHAGGRQFYWATSGQTTHPAVISGLWQTLQHTEEAQFRIASCLEGSLSFFLEPSVRWNTSSSDFTIADINHGPVPMSLYLVAPPCETDKTGPLFTAMIRLMLARMAEPMAYADGIPVQRFKHEVSCYLDELNCLGPMPELVRAMNYTQAYGLRFCFTVSDFRQLQARYGSEGASKLWSNCKTKVVMAPWDVETAKFIAGKLGLDETFASDIQKIASTHALVFKNGMKPFFTEKFLYYQDAVFENWAKLPAAT